MQNDCWYVEEDGNIIGPLRRDEIDFLILEGRIIPTTLIAKSTGHLKVAQEFFASSELANLAEPYGEEERALTDDETILSDFVTGEAYCVKERALAEAKAKAAAKVEAEASAEAIAKAEAKLEADARAEAIAKAEAKLEADARAEAIAKAEAPLRCPSCKSTQVTADKKGFGMGKAVGGLVLLGPLGLLGGFAGSGKVRITCLKCGYAFEPGQGL